MNVLYEMGLKFCSYVQKKNTDFHFFFIEFLKNFLGGLSQK